MDRKRGEYPEPLSGSEIGSFAHNTIIERLPVIASRVLEENELPQTAIERMNALIRELPGGPIRPLLDTHGPDYEDWNEYVAPYEGWSWLDVPFFFAETYFYRRIIEAVGYFEADPTERIDPFLLQKNLGLETTQVEIRRLSRQLGGWLESRTWRREVFERLVYLDLWGNQADLSLWPAGDEGQPRHDDFEAARAHLIADETSAASAYVASWQTNGERRVDFLVDNAGFEFIGDLLLADYLLETNVAGEVILHVKRHPTFVSDAVVEDVFRTVTFLGGDADPATRAFGQRLRAHLVASRMRLDDDLYWTSPLSGWEMPERVREVLSRADLVVSKGDANYRRLLGDRRWPFETSFQEAVSYFPAPLLALRTLKSDLAVGVPEGETEVLFERDPAWRTSGRWGVVHFLPPAES